jgi:hypothetical protein
MERMSSSDTEKERGLSEHEDEEEYEEEPSYEDELTETLEEEDSSGGLRAFWQRHARKLWWVHSLYALALGGFVATFAQKGYQHARWLVVSLGVAWLFLLFFFRIWGVGAAHEQTTKKEKIRFYMMTYVLKNLYQGMIFFMLPFYWRSGTMDGSTRWFFILLCVCALIATMDLVFDRVLMRWHLVASFFYGLILFACINLVIPALLPGVSSLVSLLLSGGVTICVYWTLHFPLRSLKDIRLLAILCFAVGMAAFAAYTLRPFIPPVPLYVEGGAVGSELLSDGRMAMEVTTVHESKVNELHAVTDVFVPGGDGKGFLHVWSLNGQEIHRVTASFHEHGEGGLADHVRLFSALTGEDLPVERVGDWSVDVETNSGQLVGRVRFTVFQ